MAISYAQLCRLSRVFTSAVDLRDEHDRAINEWLKEQIEHARRCRRCDFGRGHELHYAGTVDGHAFEAPAHE